MDDNEEAPAPAPPPAAPEPDPTAPAQDLVTYLTTRDSEEYGPAGHFIELTPDAASALGDLVVVPTEDQLKFR